MKLQFYLSPLHLAAVSLIVMQHRWSSSSINLGERRRFKFRIQGKFKTSEHVWNKINVFTQDDGDGERFFDYPMVMVPFHECV